MKVSRNFVKFYLVLFVLVILANIVTPFFKLWNVSYLLTLCGFIIALFFLIYRKKDDGILKFFKLLVLIIPVFIIGFIFYSNFIVSNEFVYNYDIGSEKDASKSFLSPLNRISEADLNESYRNLTGQLVYFDVLIPRGSDRITIQAKIRNTLENSSILLGAKNKQEWSYLSKSVFNPVLERMNLTGKITRLNPLMPEISSIDEIPSGSVVATDLSLGSKVRTQDFNLKEFETTGYLRESHTFYIYLENSLNLYVEKQEINWYEGEDILNISLKDLNGTLLGRTTILDDGTTNTTKTNNFAMNSSLVVSNLTKGVYILELQGNADTIITKLKLNTHKIVSKRIFSADSANYLRNTDVFARFYTETSKDSQINFQTYHQDYLQNITIGNNTLELQERAVAHPFQVKQGKYTIILPKSNVIIQSLGYLTFSEENYFEPFEYSTVAIPIKKEELNGIDYIITDYVVSKENDGWTQVETSFEMKDLYITNGKLSLMFNVPHLAESRNESNMFHVAVDSINITIQKDGIFKI